MTDPVQISAIPEIMITLPDEEEFVATMRGWQYSDPCATDYAPVVEKHFNTENRTFTVYYDGVPVCGRVK